MASGTLAVIPARLGSSRFAGKIIHPYRGRPLIYYLWHHVRRARLVDHLVIATDSPEIRRAAESFGADVVMTSSRHRTGSDRVAEVAGLFDAGLVINIQGDCIGLKAPLLDRIIERLRDDRSAQYATLVRPIRSDDELFDPGVVKVVTNAAGQALWFSRYPLPYLQNATAGERWRQFRFQGHIGVYFFRRRALRTYAAWTRGPLEKAESLEQMRILENGGTIRTFRTTARIVSVDTPDDLKKIADIYK